jgi:hypothetical protein
MGAPAPQVPGQNVYEVEEELAHYGRGIPGGQVVFALLFGIAAPVALLWIGPGLFTPAFGEAAALPAYWARVCYVVAGALSVALLVWLLTGARHRALGLLVAGPFAVGFLLSLALGFKGLWMAMGAIESIGGVLAFTPWLTAFVFAREGVRALRAGADLSPTATGVSLVVGTAALLGIVAFAVGVRRRQARLLTDQLLSKRADERRDALSRMLETGLYDPDEIAVEYTRLAKGHRLRPHVAEAYEALTDGEPITFALRRMGAEVEEPKPPEGPDLPRPTTATRAPARPSTARPSAAPGR